MYQSTGTYTAYPQTAYPQQGYPQQSYQPYPQQPMVQPVVQPVYQCINQLLWWCLLPSLFHLEDLHLQCFLLRCTIIIHLHRITMDLDLIEDHHLRMDLMDIIMKIVLFFMVQ